MTNGSDNQDQPGSPPLTAIERVVWGATRSVNERPLLKRLSHAFLRTGGAAWVYYCTRNLVRLTGEAAITSLNPDRGVILASNHRSFFDMYVIASVLLRRCRWIRRMYFPVRSAYFYDRLDGLVVNAIMSGLAMYPPVFRDPRRRHLNRHTIDFLASELQRSGTIVGLHPEGRRGTGDDPYTLLPAHPGIGELVHRARPLVLPVFILGLSNNLGQQVRGNFNGQGAPVTITFGTPVDLAEQLVQPARARTYLAIAGRIRDEIAMLGARDREGNDPRVVSGVTAVPGSTL
jgi:1-acyl-sn-glycerol-3-phosphate acyltransferase